jgi:4-amino-4-deoxy-L-arabinose transferase-like glycosyltransferase
LYPALLAAVTFGHKEFIPVVLLQSLIGAATVWCAALIAREMFGERVAVVAALLTAVYPYYVIHDTALQETGLYTFLTVFAVFLLMRVRASGSRSMAAAAGLILGADVLARANLAPFALVAPFWLLVPAASAKATWRRAASTCLVCAGVAMVAVAPWLVRSYMLNGSPTLTTQSGFFLWLGNNRYTFSRYPTQSIDLSQRVALAALTPKEHAEIVALGTNEAAVDRWFLGKGLDYIRAHPWRTIGDGFRKIAAGFCVLPSPRRSFWPDLIYLLSYGPVMILGLCGMWIFRSNWRDHLIFYALFASFAAVTAVFFGHTSYRVYLDVYWIMFAASLLDRTRTGRPVIIPNKIS